MMRVDHVILFVDNRIAHYENLYRENKSEFDRVKEAYDAKWWRKVFGIVYEVNWGTNPWDFLDYATWLSQLQALKRVAVYNQLIGVENMDIPSGWVKSFYRWAEKELLK